MRRIIFYIANSLEDFEGDLEDIKRFLNGLNNILVDSGVIVSVREAADGSDPEAIAGSSHFYLLVGESLNEVAKEEFEEALRDFREGDNPLVVTYFYDLPDRTSDESVDSLKERLRQELGHFYAYFSHPDSIKLDMVMELERDPDFHGGISFRDGEAKLGNVTVLSLDDVPLYAKNSDIAGLREERDRLDAAFAEAVKAYSGQGPQVLLEKIEPVNQRRSEVNEKLHALEANLLGLYERVSDKSAPSDWRTREASRLLGEGNYEGALAILEDEERERELERAEARIETGGKLVESGRQDVATYISQGRLRISALLAESVDPKRIEEVDKSFGKLCDLARKHHVEMDVLLDYAVFLQFENRFTEAAKVAEEYLHLQIADDATDGSLTATYNLLGSIYYNAHHYAEAESLFRKALAIHRNLDVAEPGTHLLDVARAANDLAALLARTRSYREAESLFREALAIYKNLAAEEPGIYVPDIAGTTNNLALLLARAHRYEEAEPFYREALATYRLLATGEPRTYLPDVAMVADNLALLLVDTRRDKEAEQLYREALATYRDLAAREPRAYLPDVAVVANNFASLLAEKRHDGEAEFLFKEALATYRSLDDGEAGAYLPDIAMAASNLANFLTRNRRYEEAEPLFREALAIYRSLDDEGPEAHLPDMAGLANNLAFLLAATRRYGKAEPLFREALAIYRSLDDVEPGACLPDMAKTVNNLANLLNITGRHGEAEPLFREALAKYEELEIDQPRHYAENIAAIRKILDGLPAN